jgi:uncharacterized protein
MALRLARNKHLEKNMVEADGTVNYAHTNRLVHETSTYLLQHAHNPVDWYPWGKEALEKSKKEDKPILLSIGYAACHWCHVMEHESFENEETAQLMNANFVCIKVDREERTDLDEIYMKAVQLMTGHGGWPMTVFLTPEMRPFFGGTYFPPEDRHGLPSFKRLLLSLNETWRNRREDINESAKEISEHLKSFEKAVGEKGLKIKPEHDKIGDNITAAAKKFLTLSDNQWGGFGSSPKFPHTFSIDVCMRSAAYLSDKTPSLKESFSQVVATTLDKMAYGGINDQIGGGFARYSVDRYWLVPHFEKMLYDNALLCKSYIDGYFLMGRDYWLNVAEEILKFTERELQTADGAFFSSLDADSEGEEGKFYVFTPAQTEEILGSDADWINKVFGVTKNGNFEHGSSVLHLSKSPEDLASESKLSVPAFWQKLKPSQEKLLNARSKRIRPGRDEKVLTSWNSIMISAYVEGYKATGKPEYLSSATRTAHFIQKELMKGDRLLRTWGQGKARLNGYADDYAYFVQALLDLASVDSDPIWTKDAIALTDSMINHFSDQEKIGFYYTSDDHEELLTRPRANFDSSIPSATSVATFNLIRLAKLTDKKNYQQRAEKIINHYLPFFTKMPDQFANLIAAADFAEAKSIEIVLVGKKNDKQALEILLEIHRHYLPNKVVIYKDPFLDEKSEGYSKELVLLQERVILQDKPTVYICENYTCDAPLTDTEALRSRLSSLSAKIAYAESEKGAPTRTGTPK